MPSFMFNEAGSYLFWTFLHKFVLIQLLFKDKNETFTTSFCLGAISWFVNILHRILWYFAWNVFNFAYSFIFEPKYSLNLKTFIFILHFTPWTTYLEQTSLNICRWNHNAMESTKQKDPFVFCWKMHNLEGNWRYRIKTTLSLYILRLFHLVY